LRDTGAGWTLVWRVLLVVLGLIWTSGALAHTFLVNTDPRPGTRFTTAPQVVSMQFGEAVDFRRSTVTLRKIGSPAVRLAPCVPVQVA
jgi:methionine-rich copper-binding protein CopC